VKKKQAAKGIVEPPSGIRVSAHPRAQRSIRRTRGWAGLIGFALVLMASLQAGVPDFESGVRALLGGIAFQLLAWAASVALWRRMIIAELELVRLRLEAEAAADD
jgi:hypothetical protein